MLSMFADESLQKPPRETVTIFFYMNVILLFIYWIVISEKHNKLKRH